MKAIRLPLRGAAALLAVGLASTALAGARAETSIVVDVATGAVLSQKDATKRWYPASTTKLMTAYVTLKAVKEGRIGLDAPVVMTRYAAAQAPSRMGFEPGSVMRLDNALRMMMVKSANDVAVAIAQTVGGRLQAQTVAAGEAAPSSVPVSVRATPQAPTLDISSPEAGALATFVDAMNADAGRLGLADTHFINPNGLPGEGQHSSARDLALLGVTIRRELADFLPYFGIEAIRAGDAVMHNGNGLLGRVSGADGMKTGYICASGFNLVGSATRNGRTLVGVVLGSDRSSLRDRHMAALLEDGFNATPGAGSMKITDMAAGGGETADISERMCSPAGRTARANAVKAEEAAIAEAAAKKKPSPVQPQDLPDAARPPTIVDVGLGGAAGTDRIAANISLIPAYGIPRPTFRPNQPNDAAHAAAAAKAAPLRGSQDERTASTANLAVDLGVTKRGGIPVPKPRVAN